MVVPPASLAPFADGGHDAAEAAADHGRAAPGQLPTHGLGQGAGLIVALAGAYDGNGDEFLHGWFQGGVGIISPAGRGLGRVGGDAPV